MAIKLDLTRPEDLLSLSIEGHNLRLDAADPADPALVIADAQHEAFLIVTFPPQTIAETAFFEASIVSQDPASAPPDPDAGTVTEPLPAPGGVKARIGHPSRLVFRVPPGQRVPFSIQGLLDWSALELSVNPIAAIGPEPTSAQIAAAPAIARPKPHETAIELPYRLIISPSAGVAWAHRLGPFTSRGRTELWHTRLQRVTPQGPAELSRADPAPLRAIWSDDYNRIKPPAPTLSDPDLGRTAMAPNDRHQIVILTSAFHGYEVDEEFRIAVGAGGLEFRARELDRFTRVPVTRTVPYVPQPFFAEELMLSALGGWLRSRGHWNPPRTARPSRLLQFPKFEDLVRRVERLPEAHPQAAAAAVPAPWLLLPGTDPLLLALRDMDRIAINPEEEQLDLSEWVHIAAQGRDHYVRIVYEGELWPFRQRAALVKITERKFREHNGLIVAYLFQRMFIVVREPEKRFGASDRGMPFKRVRLTTLVTPDIADPGVIDPAHHSGVIPGTNRSFWVEVMTGATTRTRFKFHAVGTDIAGDGVDFTVPMMFVSISESGTTRPIAAVEYNASGSAQLLAARGALVPGQKAVFAERDPAAPSDNTRLVTRGLNFVMDAAGTAPTLLKADVNIPQVQELLGTDAPTSIRLLKSYVDNGLDAATGVFAEVVKEDFGQFLPANPFAGLVADTLGVTFSSDQAGGFATPNVGVSTLSRRLGPLAGKVADAMSDAFDPATFFKKGMATLFGTFDLVDLLPAATLSKNAPKLRTESQDIPGGKLLVATLDWEPEVQNLDLGVAALVKDHGAQSKLLIHGRIRKSVMLPGGGPPADGVTFEFTGTLNDFQVSVLKSVFINFVEFAFVARSGSKPDVSVTLDPAKPVEFAGDLAFVEELRKAISPGLFGDGPSLDIAPTGIRAGFAFALPPIAVGVFALKDISLGAALTLPFLDGKPTFDFNVSTREHPFLLSVSIFGGGGFFRLQLDTAGMKLVEAALEFGAAASIDIGVASGGVLIMAGIYFKLERQDPSNDLAPTLSGYLRMGGYLSVLGLIKLSIEFNLSFTYDGARDKAYGRATLTVKVEIAFFSTSVEMTVERAFGGQGGDPGFGQMFSAPAMWSEYALAFA